MGWRAIYRNLPTPLVVWQGNTKQLTCHASARAAPTQSPRWRIGHRTHTESASPERCCQETSWDLGKHSTARELRNARARRDHWDPALVPSHFREPKGLSWQVTGKMQVLKSDTASDKSHPRSHSISASKGNKLLVPAPLQQMKRLWNLNSEPKLQSLGLKCP